MSLPAPKAAAQRPSQAQAKHAVPSRSGSFSLLLNAVDAAEEHAAEDHPLNSSPFVAVQTPPTQPLPLEFNLPKPEVRKPGPQPKAELSVAVPVAFVLPEGGQATIPAPSPEPEKADAHPAPAPAKLTVEAQSAAPLKAELAFAAKVAPKQPVPPAESAPAAPKTASAPPPEIPVAFKQVVHELPQAPPQRVTVAFAPEPPRTETKTEVRETPRVLEILPEPAAINSATALRDISFRLTDSSKDPVEVRLIERAGELRVSVRSANSELNTELRNGLGDLAGKLEKVGFQAEMWRPESEKSSPQQQQQHPQRQQTPEPPPSRTKRPKWVEEIAANFSIGDEQQ